MQKKPEEALGQLFEIYDQIRRAEIERDESLMRIKQKEGLTESCLFLSKLVHDLVENKEPKELSELSVDIDILKTIQRKNLLEKFITIETKLLLTAGLKSNLIEELVRVIRFIYSKELIPIDWHGDLVALKNVVCVEAQNYADNIRLRKVLKKTIVAGGGLVIGMVNLFHPNIPAEFRAASTSTGAFMLGASFDFLKDYLERP